MKQLGLIEWSIEAAVAKFAREFTQDDIDLARREAGAVDMRP
jgi:hypothetical protein